MDNNLDNNLKNNKTTVQPTIQPTIPFNMSEEEVLVIINKVAKSLSNKFKFGYHETKDMEQQARLLAWQGLVGYDGVRPLENYLWTTVHNRLFNFKRDNYFRPYCPCLKCDSCKDKQCDKYSDNSECSIFEGWTKQNVAKLNIIHPLEFSCVDDSNEHKLSSKDSAEDYLINNELKKVLDKHIPLEYRHHYLRLVYGYKVLKKYKEPLLNIIQEIINEHYKDLGENLEGGVDG